LEYNLQQNALKLNPAQYPNFPEFGKFNIPLEHIEAAYILTAQRIRTKYGIPMTPSPAQGGFVRFDGSTTSTHYAVGRLVNAGDWFPKIGGVLQLHERLLTEPGINGIGLYADTHLRDKDIPHPMIHFDTRPLEEGFKKVLWVRDNGKYYYADVNPREYHFAKFKVMAIEHGLDFRAGEALGKAWGRAMAESVVLESV
jgi:hypothetical protein